MLDKVRQMTMLTKLITILTVANVFACTTKAEPLKPALVVASERSEQLLAQSMAVLFNGQQIKLASSAFLQSSTITIERVNANHMGRVIQGRVIEPPQTITLVSDGRDCFLHHEQLNKQVRVNDLRCTIVSD